ncbi:MAG TPA: outer membrane beta-barrel protein [Ohtaekwangia sp.]|nr:outer membrane beta-barrel protein [Ohtaekwangia sp.]
MKKLLIVSVIACCVFGKVHAQISQGAFLLGGGISHESTKMEFDGEEIGDELSFSFGPSLGYFVTDGIAVGLNLSIVNEKAREDDFDFGPYEVTSSAIGIGPFVRLYKASSNENFAFFAQGSISYIFGDQKETFDGDSDKTKFNGLDVAISPGFAYFFNERWSAEFLFRGIAYTSLTPDTEMDDFKQTTITIGLDSLSPTLGLRVYFGQ